MGKDSSIQWTTHTFNPWRGCTKVSAGCASCYAETLSKRNPAVLGQWGPNGTRVVASESKWREPFAWDRAASAAGERHRVFCASLADVFEDWSSLMVNSRGETLWDHVFDWGPGSHGARGTLMMDDVRIRLWDTILATPHIDWLLLTKRPENVLPTLRRMKATRLARRLDDGVLRAWIDGSHPPDNVWLGTSVENQEQADKRIPILLKIPAAVRFLSMEPMLGPVTMAPYLPKWHSSRCPLKANCDWSGPECPQCGYASGGVDWVIVGGESGSKARPFDLAWGRSIRDQCAAAGVPFFMKQVGSRPGTTNHPLGCVATHASWKPDDSHGGEPDEWPEDIRIREFPRAAEVSR